MLALHQGRKPLKKELLEKLLISLYFFKNISLNIISIVLLNVMILIPEVNLLQIFQVKAATSSRNMVSKFIFYYRANFSTITFTVLPKTNSFFNIFKTSK